MPPTARRAESTAKRAKVQASVLEALEALLGEGETYAELNVERIARRAGISRTAFYFYFRDKREVLERLAETVASELFTAAKLWFSGTEDDSTAIPEAIGIIARLFAEHGPMVRAVIEVSTYEPEVAAFWRGLLERFVDATDRRIREEQLAGRAPDYPSRPTAFTLVWGVERVLYQQLVQDDLLPHDELVDAIASTWTRSIYGRVPKSVGG
ncbi:MAG: TetR/AcrR family transcriptional regulator [Solirubrobacteraceae bacterium]